MSTDKLCNEMIDNVENESKTIISRIDSFYKENETNKAIKDLLYENFQEQIEEFKSKYAYTHVALINKTNNEVINIDLECSKKLEIIVDNLTNYIKNM